MFNEETRSRIRRLEIVTSRLVDEVFAGQYSSLFKGRGVEFAEVREYLEGDDVRAIDWNLTARFGRPFVKLHDEDRELTLVLAVDVSASQGFGSATCTKAELASELAAVLAFSAMRNNDKVGLLLFSDRVEKYLPPRCGRSHALRLLREILSPAPQGRRTDLTTALGFLARVLKRRTLIFVLSDFLVADLAPGLPQGNSGAGLSAGGHDEVQAALATPLGTRMRQLALRHEVTAFRLSDPQEESLPAVGRLRLQDLESGRTLRVQTSSPAFRERYAAAAQRRREVVARFLAGCGTGYAEFSTHESVVDPLLRFFKRKARQGRARRRQ